MSGKVKRNKAKHSKPQNAEVRFFRLPFLFSNRFDQEDHIRRWRSSNKHGLLICVECGWSWLKIETAKISSDGEVECRSQDDCFRRQTMKMKPK